MTSPFPFVVDCKTGHKSSLSQYVCPYVIWLQLYLPKGGLFLPPLMWDISKCDTSTSLQSACTWKFALSRCFRNLKPPCKHINKPVSGGERHMSSHCHCHWVNPQRQSSTDWPLVKAPEWAQLRPSGPSSWAQPRLQAPQLGTNEMDVALFKPPNLGCFASFFFFVSIYPSSPPLPLDASCFLFVLL